MSNELDKAEPLAVATSEAQSHRSIADQSIVERRYRPEPADRAHLYSRTQVAIFENLVRGEFHFAAASGIVLANWRSEPRLSPHHEFVSDPEAAARADRDRMDPQRFVNDIVALAAPTDEDSA